MERKAIFTKAVPEQPVEQASSKKPVSLNKARATPPLVWIRELAATNIELLMDLYVQGQSMHAIALLLEEAFPAISISPSRLRAAILECPRGRELWAQSMIDRSHMLIEGALDAADKAAQTGDSGGYRTAADIRMKIAAKLNQREYGEKQSLLLHGTGKDGAIKTETQPEAMTDEALMRVIAAQREAHPAPTKH